MITGSVASRPITGLASLWHSTIGKKYVMAVTGLIWFGYLIVHLWGNLKIYAGPLFLNDYGASGALRGYRFAFAETITGGTLLSRDGR